RREGSRRGNQTMFATMAALPPDPLIGFDYEAAEREGWTLSETCDLTGKPLVQLQALDQHAVPSGFATLLPSDRPTVRPGTWS
ncbi:MAG: hypothetical protein ACRYFY_05615, partial [Janthinobacterium lividum]